MKRFSFSSVLLWFAFISLVFPIVAAASELPRPEFGNTFCLTFHMPVNDPVYLAAQAERIHQLFPNKIYHQLGVSTFVSLIGDWSASFENQLPYLQEEFNRIKDYLRNCRDLDIGLHVGFLFGFVRNVGAYNQAKKEDLRNCQWYSDGKLASDTQLENENAALNTYIWLSISRYAQKARRLLQANSRLLGEYLSQIEKEFPHTFIAASGAGEAELNYHRIDYNVADFPVTDYSPFAVLEFRDWILHQGMYDDHTGEYAYQGYQYGGDHYQDDEGLDQFNLEFGTEFTTWDLKYYHFDLNHSDATRISWQEIPDKGKLLPETSSAFYIAGGFDPPRRYDAGDPFWRLWDHFRREMVRNYTRDIAKCVWEAGFQSGRWYSHQIPADYLWGNSPELGNYEHRLVSSASPFWTADVAPYGKMGATCFDLRYPDIGYKSTSEYLLPFMQSTGKDWAILEFDPFSAPPQLGLPQESDLDLITQKYRQTKESGVHLVSVFKWEDATGEHRTLGAPKLQGLQTMWHESPPLPWGTPPTYPWTPPIVTDLRVEDEGERIRLEWNDIIWHDLPYTWKQLPQFDNFAVYCREGNNEIRLLGHTRDPLYQIPRPSVQAEYLVKARFQNGSSSRDCEFVPYPVQKTPFFPRERIEVTLDPSRSTVYSGDFRVSASADHSWRIRSSDPGLVLEPLSGRGDAWLEYTLDPSKLPRAKSLTLTVTLLDNVGQVLDNLQVFVHNFNQEPKPKDTRNR